MTSKIMKWRIAPSTWIDASHRTYGVTHRKYDTRRQISDVKPNSSMFYRKLK